MLQGKKVLHRADDPIDTIYGQHHRVSVLLMPHHTRFRRWHQRRLGSDEDSSRISLDFTQLFLLHIIERPGLADSTAHDPNPRKPVAFVTAPGTDDTVGVVGRADPTHEHGSVRRYQLRSWQRFPSPELEGNHQDRAATWKLGYTPS